MGDYPKPGDEGYLKFVKSWLIAKLKDIKDMENPPINYKTLLEELDNFEHEIIELQLQSKMLRCSCGHKNNKHAKDCRIHPHFMVILKDTSENKLGVPSLFLEPILFVEEPEQAPKLIEKDPDVNEEVKENYNPIEDGGEIMELASEINPKPETREFSVIYFDGTDLPLVCKPSDFLGDSFILDEQTGFWFFEDFEGILGKATFLGPAHNNGCIIVVEASIEQMREAVAALTLCLKPFFRKELREEIIKILPE